MTASCMMMLFVIASWMECEGTFVHERLVGEYRFQFEGWMENGTVTGEIRTSERNIIPFQSEAKHYLEDMNSILETQFLPSP